jgi:hypothetical protein
LIRSGIGSTLLRRLTARREAPYWRISSFLPPRGADVVLREMIERRGEFRARGRDSTGRPTFYRMMTPFGPCPEFLGRFEELAPLLQRRFGSNLRGAQIELLGQAYNDGGSFRKHSDADAGGPNWQRRLSGIYYVHAQPRKFEGGSLVVYDRHGTPHRVEPDHNSAVFFPRDLVHEVLPVACTSKAFEDSRFAINIWIS